MTRARLSTTVDPALLGEARRVAGTATDAALIDEALRALLASRRSAEFDDAYRGYDDAPLSEPDAWGDLGSFRVAAARS